jgi:hypothetical protein
MNAVHVRTLPAQLDQEEREFITSDCLPAQHTVEVHPAPLFSTLRSIRANGRIYTDKGAACACQNLQLYINADYGYTVCEAHGLLAVGHLEHVITNGKAAVKHG